MYVCVGFYREVYHIVVRAGRGVCACVGSGVVDDDEGSASFI